MRVNGCAEYGDFKTGTVLRSVAAEICQSVYPLLKCIKQELPDVKEGVGLRIQLYDG